MSPFESKVINMTNQLIDPKSHKQLFIDDHAIERTFAIKKNMHKPSRKGAVLKADQGIGQVRVASWSPPLWNGEKDLWEWWYWAMYDGIDHHNELPSKMYALEGRVSHYATSTDGFHWDTPEVGLYEFRGSKINNVAYDCSALDLNLLQSLTKFFIAYV